MSSLLSRQMCQIVSFGSPKVEVPRLSATLILARQLEIPIFECSAEVLSVTVLEKLGKYLKLGSEQDRRVTLVCGSYLEGQIVVAAQYMLAQGFDVYLLRDLIVPMSAEHAQIHDFRLLQAGAIETTSAQVVYELMAAESDRVVLSVLSEFLQQ